MRRSSWLALAAAGVLFTTFGILSQVRSESPAPPMSDAVVRALIERGRTAAEHKDVDSIMALFAPDSHLLDIDPERLRPLIAGAMDELGSSHFNVNVKNVNSRAQFGRGYASADVDIDENLKGAIAHYYHLHLTMTLERRRASRWLGLTQMEEWKITRLDSEPSFGIPTY